jgi:hypothetical protein
MKRSQRFRSTNSLYNVASGHCVLKEQVGSETKSQRSSSVQRTEQTLWNIPYTRVKCFCSHHWLHIVSISLQVERLNVWYLCIHIQEESRWVVVVIAKEEWYLTYPCKCLTLGHREKDQVFNRGNELGCAVTPTSTPTKSVRRLVNFGLCLLGR